MGLDRREHLDIAGFATTSEYHAADTAFPLAGGRIGRSPTFLSYGSNPNTATPLAEMLGVVPGDGNRFEPRAFDVPLADPLYAVTLF